jgi:hypothetical protein
MEGALRGELERGHDYTEAIPGCSSVWINIVNHVCASFS